MPGEGGTGRPPLAIGRCIAAVLLSINVYGCSLVTIKSPEIPLSAREQEIRLRTRDYAAHFSTTLGALMDDASHQENTPAAHTQGLRIKLGAVAEITRASTGLSPTASLLDTWAFAIQLRAYLDAGPGAALFGVAQPALRVGVSTLAEEAQILAQDVSGGDYSRFDAFVNDYAARNPLQNADMLRASVLSAWLAQDHDKGAVRTVGTVAQALGDVSDRMRIYAERVPTLGLWQAELALDRAGVDDASYRAALRSMDEQLERIARLAESSPQLAHEALAEFHATAYRVDASWAQTLRTLRAEREALASNIMAEREAFTAAVDEQRARITADAALIATQAVDTSWRELRKLIRETFLLALLGVILLLGLPFAAGYLAGRRRAGSPHT